MTLHDRPISQTRRAPVARAVLNKVPEVTVFFCLTRSRRDETPAALLDT